MVLGRLKTYAGTFIILMGFWLLITWSLHYQSILLGLISSLLVVWFCRDILIFEDERPRIAIRNILRLVVYLVNLVIEIVKANIHVAIIVLNPRMPISPTLVEFKTNVKSDLGKVILANSITLTPGTLTIDLERDVYLVHCLTRENAASVVNWHMATRLLEMEEV